MNWPRLSRRLNRRLGGGQEMLCARIHRNRWLRTERVIDALCWLLWRERKHCRRCWWDEHGPRVRMPADIEALPDPPVRARQAGL